MNDAHIATLFAKGKYQDVTESYNETSIKLGAAAMYFVGISHLFCNAFRDAEHMLSQLKRNAVELPDYNTFMALTKLRLGKYNQANAFIKQSQPSVMHFEINIELAIKCGQVRRAKRLILEAVSNDMMSVNIEINDAIINLYQSQPDRAEKQLVQILKKYPDNILVYDKLVTIYSRTNQHFKNEQIIQQYLAKYPDHSPYLWQLCMIYVAQGRKKELERTFERLTLADKQFTSLREVFLTSSIYMSDAEINSHRVQLVDRLNVAIKNKEAPPRPDKTFGCTPFYLAYHSQENKVILEKIVTVFKKGLIQAPKIIPKKKRSKKIHVAVISQHFYNNSVMDFYAHTLINFPDAFHVTIINVDPTKIDDITKALYRRADKHYQTSKAQDELVPLVMESQFDMVIYPEIGMSPCIYFLAMQRLAPIQMVLMGHPETTGMTTIDYYVSWANFHGKKAHSQFTEQLIQLKNIPMCYDYPDGMDAIKKPLKNLGITSKGKKIFAIPVTLFKFQPVFDAVIQKIIAKSPNHLVVMMCYNRIENVLIQRLKQGLTDKQATQIVFKLPFKRRDYYALLKKSDVVLEPFPFGGGNTVLQAMAAGTPVVSKVSDQLKGAFGAGLYQWINAPQFIAKSIDEYIDIAIKTANNPQIKSDFRDMIQTNKDRLYGNMSGSIEFYDWLKSLMTR